MGKGRFGFPLLAATVAALSMIGGPAASQLSGDIKGHIRDAQGQALPGAAVKLLQAGKGEPREQVSDAEGNFHFEGLASGVYIATVALEGFAPVTCPGARVVGTTRELQVTLAPAGGEQASSCRPAT
jgi:hypothetical protein